MGVLSPAGLRAIADHKYQSGGYTPLDLVMYKCWWDHAINFVPLWMAPNLVTLLGTLCLLVSFLAMFAVCPDLESPAPNWVYLLGAVCQFLYQTLDAIDGKQARRTGSSSPLGQLFDHGCDSVGTLLVMMPILAALRLGVSMWGVLALAAVQAPFFLAQWEERHTHVCRTNTGGIGVTEGQWISIGVLVSAGLTGGGFWLLPISQWLPKPVVAAAVSVFGAAAADFKANQCLGLALFVSNVLMMVYNLYVVGTRVPGKAKLIAFFELVPLAVLLGSGIAWIDTECFRQLPWVCYSTLGALFSHLTSQVILYSMAKMDFPNLWRQLALLPLPLVVANSRMGWSQTHFGISAERVATLYLVLVMIAVFRFLFAVVQELTEFLNIYCLSLKKKPAKPAKQD